MKKKMYIFMVFLAIIGAINWGLVGLFSFDLVATIFGPLSLLTRLIYILVGVAGAYLAFMIKKISDSFL